MWLLWSAKKGAEKVHTKESVEEEMKDENRKIAALMENVMKRAGRGKYVE